MAFLKELTNQFIDYACLALTSEDSENLVHNELNTKRLFSSSPNQIRNWKVAAISEISNKAFETFGITKIEKATSNIFALLAEMFSKIERFILSRVISIKVEEKIEKHQQLAQEIERAFDKKIQSPLYPGGKSFLEIAKDIQKNKEESASTRDPLLLSKFERDLGRHLFEEIEVKEKKGKNLEETAHIQFSENKLEQQEAFKALVKPTSPTDKDIMSSDLAYYKTLQLVLRQDAVGIIVPGLSLTLDEAIKKSEEGSGSSNLAPYVYSSEGNPPIKKTEILKTFDEDNPLMTTTVTHHISAKIVRNEGKNNPVVGSYTMKITFSIDAKGVIESVKAEAKITSLDLINQDKKYSKEQVYG